MFKGILWRMLATHCCLFQIIIIAKMHANLALLRSFISALGHEQTALC